jgi:hypothetical protein
MKRSREEEIEEEGVVVALPSEEDVDTRDPSLELELEKITALVSTVRKKLKRGNNTPVVPRGVQPGTTLVLQPDHMKKQILHAVGDIAEDAPVEAKSMPSGVMSYSLGVEYPNCISSKERTNILNIEHVVQGAIESAGKGKMRLTMVYCPDKQVALQMHSKSIVQRDTALPRPINPEDTDAVILYEVQSFIPFIPGEVGKTTLNPYLDGISQVVYIQKVQSPVKFSQVDQIGLKDIIQDISFTPSQDSDHLRVIVKYLKKV